MKKIAIVTSLIGAYDSKLLEISYDKTKYDFICFTNNKKLKSNTWNMVIVDLVIPNNKPKSSYFYKWSLHKVLDHEKYDIAVWMDSSIWQFNIIKFEEYLNKFINMPDKSLYIEKHPGRSTLKSELDANIHYNKDDHNKMINQVNRYFKEGFNDSTDCIMVETGFSFRRYKDPDLIRMSDLLWEEMKSENSTKRDQLIFDYAVWKTKFKSYIALFTFDEKSEILKFADHPHISERKEKILLCGPWQGEIGWELFAWQGYLRWISENEAFDKIVIGTEPESKFMYDDFADQIILTPASGNKRGCLLNEKEPFFKIQNTQDKELRLIKPTMNVCYNIFSNLDKQSLIPFNFPEDFKKKYSNLDFDEINLALKNKELPSYLRSSINLPKKNNFKIIVIGGPAEKYITKCLDSIKSQTNINWECQVVLTPFPDKTFEIAKKYECNKIKVVLSDKDSFVIKNIQYALDLLKPNDEDIICTVDADDWLANNDVLSTIDRYYMSNKDLLLTYGSWCTWPENKQIPNNSFSYNETDFTKGIRRTLFRGTHFRTMKYKVFKNIPKNEFKDKNDNIYTVAGDAAIMIPALEMVGYNRSKFVPEILYVYNRETEFNEDKSKRDQSIAVTLDIAQKPVLSLFNYDKYKIISLYDKTFPHGKTVMNYNFKNFDSDIAWNRSLTSESLFLTDFTINEFDKFSNKEKYALLIEPKVIFPQIYEDIKKINNKFTKVFTHDEELLKLGENYCLSIAGGCWIEPKYQSIYNKTKDISIIVSTMNRTEGHKLRHSIVNSFKQYIDVFGKAYNPIPSKLQALQDYKFQIVVENCRVKNYFSEKLIDCLVTGVVPLYYGCTNLKDFGLDMNGIFEFSNLTELNKLLSDIKNNKINYDKFKSSIEFNFNKAKEYMVTENWLYNNYFKK